MLATWEVTENATGHKEGNGDLSYFGRSGKNTAEDHRDGFGKLSRAHQDEGVRLSGDKRHNLYKAKRQKRVCGRCRELMKTTKLIFTEYFLCSKNCTSAVYTSSHTSSLLNRRFYNLLFFKKVI